MYFDETVCCCCCFLDVSVSKALTWVSFDRLNVT